MPKTAEEKELEARRAAATHAAAEIYFQRHRSGDDLPIPACCALAAAQTGLPRPAESSVRRAIARMMTPDERRAKQQKDAAADRRAAATERAAVMYKQMNASVAEGEEAAVSIAGCCDMAAAECGVRPAESSLRRALERLYKKDGMEMPKLKKARPSPAAVTPATATDGTAVGPGAAQPKAKRKKADAHSGLPSDEDFAAGLLGFAPVPNLPSTEEVEIVQV